MRDISLLVVGLLAAATVAASTTPPHDHRHDASPHRHLGVVPEGHLGALTADLAALFWDTEAFACTGGTSTTSPSAPASCADDGARWWTLDVTAAAPLLRVDLDQPFRQDRFRLEVTSPSGTTHRAESETSYSTGVRFTAPEPGRWQVTLVPLRTDGTVLRIRAGLTTAERPEHGPLLPNLRVLPPFEFGFAAPANPTNPQFVASDDQNPPLAVAGRAVSSCTADEVQEASDPTRQASPEVHLRCLRFTTGPQNVGRGHFDVRFPILDRALEERDRLVEMTQVIHEAGGRTTTRPAGTYEFHVTHAHYHYADILTYEAFRVADPVTGGLEPVGRGVKSGFCPVDQGYGDWSSFAQLARDALRDVQQGDCLAIGGRGAMGLTAGWGDVYRWQRSGQYVDVTGVGDGRFVIRATVDLLDHVLEEDETDNVSYALVDIRGDEVTVVERGYGRDPWDPRKVVATDHRDVPLGG